jgi:hypothetical protein
VKRKYRNGRGSSWIRKAKRWAIYRRDAYACVWCARGDMMLTLDHLFVKSHRCRDNDHRRLVTACLSCNSRRGDASVKVWLRQLRGEGADLCAILARLQRARNTAIDKAAVLREMLSPLPVLDDQEHYAVVGGVPF